MPLFTKNGITILFLHIPKTGGTSITEFFRKNGFSVRGVQSYYDIDAGESSPQHRSAVKINEFIDKESINYESVFTFVRNPVDRIVSEYFFQLRRKKSIYRRVTLLGLPAKALAQQGVVTKQIGIWGFCYWVNKVFSLNNKNPILFDNHILPQTEFLIDNIKVFKYENNYHDFIQYLEELNRKYEFEIDFTDIPHYAKGVNKIDFDIPKETLAQIFNFYRADFEMFYPDVCPARL